MKGLIVIFFLHFCAKLEGATHPGPIENSVDDIIRRVRDSSNETVESYSPADFIFNSCDLEEYVTPPEILRYFPYYLSGFDQAGRPIWAVELGKFNLKKVTTGSPEFKEAFETWTKSVPYNFIKSLFMKPSPGRPTFEINFILDFEGLKMSQLTEQNMRLLVKRTKQFSRLIEEYAQTVVIINVNEAAKKVGEAVRPFVSQEILNKVESFGENRKEWLPFMEKYFPKESIPSWYGGTEDFKPVRVYG